MEARYRGIDNKGRKRFEIFDGDRAVTGWGNVTQLERDARRLAAVDDLLSACEDSLDFIETRQAYSPSEAFIMTELCERLYAAITKARGTSKYNVNRQIDAKSFARIISRHQRQYTHFETASKGMFEPLREKPDVET